MPSFLGIDSGLTMTKAVVFDSNGTVLSVARRRVPQLIPKAHHVERDMDILWAMTAEAIREAVAQSGRYASDIVGVATTAHGDGLFILDSDARPLGHGILSLDGRTSGIIDAWNKSGISKNALSLTGQVPLASSPSALLCWMKAFEPERYTRISHILSCKDWLRFCLTGTIGTDYTEASTSFTDVKTQVYSDAALELYGLEAVKQALPEVSHSASLVGKVTRTAASVTGLVEGTPVAAGIHDVTASALGIGGHKPGMLSVVAGTFSINEVVSREPRMGEGWLCRNAIEPKLWNNMAISPASSANYEWFLENLCLDESHAAGKSIHDILGAEINEALKKPSSLLFHPFLFGSPFGAQASAAFIGLRGWHSRGTLLRSIFEGIIFNHRFHIDALKTAFAFDQVMLTGGTSRNPAFAQIFATVIGLPVIVNDTPEAAAWGAALCAGAATGYYKSPQHDPRDLGTLSHRFLPDGAKVEKLESRYQLFCEAAEAMAPLWPKLEQLAKDEQSQA